MRVHDGTEGREDLLDGLEEFLLARVVLLGVLQDLLNVLAHFSDPSI